MPIDMKFVVCAILLVMLMFTGYLFVHNWVYPNTINRPFGSILFISIAAMIFIVVITVTYSLLSFVLA